MSNYANAFRFVGTLGLALEAGGFISASLTGIPALKTLSGQPAQVAFTQFFNAGKNVMLPLSLVSGACLLVSQYYSVHKDNVYYYAAASALSMVPYTLLAMSSTNNTLMNSAPSALSVSATQDLLDTWKRLNLIRGLIPLTGFITVLTHIMNR